MISWCIARFGGQRQQDGERMRSLFSPYPPSFVTYPATQPASRPTTTHITARSSDLTVLPPSPGPTASGLALARRRPQTIQSGPSGVNRQGHLARAACVDGTGAVARPPPGSPRTPPPLHVHGHVELLFLVWCDPHWPQRSRGHPRERLQRASPASSRRGRQIEYEGKSRRAAA